MRKLLAGVWTTLALILGGADSHAGDHTIASNLVASMVLFDGCIVYGSKGAHEADSNLATVDFGSAPSTFTGTVDAKPTDGVVGSARIECSPDIRAVSVSVNAGDNAGQGMGVGTGTRSMKEGASSFLPYEIYSDTAHTAVFPSNGSLGMPLPVDGEAVELPIFGRVNKTTGGAIEPGNYSDHLRVILSF